MTAEDPPALRRLLDGLWSGSGRTLAIAGPPLSGKSELLERLRTEVRGRGGRVHTLRGEHRTRDVPFATMETLDQAAPSPGLPEPAPEEEADVAGGLAVGLAYLPIDPDAAPTSRRRGAGGRGARGAPHLLGPTARNPVHVDAQEFWARWVDEVRANPRAPVLLTVDEAASVDPESREVLLYLAERARLRPIGLVLSLDSSVPSFGRWEERLAGHGDVDFHRMPTGDDPRDVARAREEFDLLPDGCRRVLGIAALLGGHVSEVVLSRVTRLSFNQLAEALLPAVEAGHVRLASGRIEFAHGAFAHSIPPRIPPAEAAEMHREIAEALAALNPEPSLDRRLELARHYYEWYRGPNALRYLLEAAELTDRLHAFDTTLDALGKALECVPSLPAADRSEAESEIRFLQAHAFAFAGLVGDAEHALREGIAGALASPVPPDRLEEWIVGLLPVLTTVGPRPSMITLLTEVAERAHAAGAAGVEIILQSVIARLELDRGRIGRAREEARRAARLATGAPPGVPQAMALEAVGLSRIDGHPDEQLLAERFLATAQRMLAGIRRYPLEQDVEAASCLLQARRGADRETLRRTRERALAQAERARNLPIELEHRLELAAVLLDESADARAGGLLKRAREISELLHLLPPAPRLLRLWLLEGRYEARAGTPAAARDRFEALAELPAASVAAPLRAEARVRAALLEASSGRDEAARAHLKALEHPELRGALRPEWTEWLAPLAARIAGPEEAQAPSTANAPGSSA